MRKTNQCKRCGRNLTNPLSIERGYGPVCFKKVNAEGSRIRDLEILVEKLTRKVEALSNGAPLSREIHRKAVTHNKAPTERAMMRPHQKATVAMMVGNGFGSELNNLIEKRGVVS